jgi:hypothetical protein
MKPTALLISILFVLLTIFFIKSHNKIHEQPFTLVYETPSVSPTPTLSIPEIIAEAFAKEQPSVRQQAENVSWCESRHHPASINSDSQATGLFQILPSTWNRYCVDLENPKDPAQNAECGHRIYAYDIHSNGNGWSQWECQASASRDYRFAIK